MKTALNLDDRLIRAAKKRAIDGGETLTCLIERALHEYLETSSSSRRFRPCHAKLVVMRGRFHPGIDPDSRDRLCERMDGRA